MRKIAWRNGQWDSLSDVKNSSLNRQVAEATVLEENIIPQVGDIVVQELTSRKFVLPSGLSLGDEINWYTGDKPVIAKP